MSHFHLIWLAALNVKVKTNAKNHLGPKRIRRCFGIIEQWKEKERRIEGERETGREGVGVEVEV